LNKLKNSTIDLIALSSAFVCAVHCAVLPILISFSSLGLLSFLNHSLIEWTFISLGVVLAYSSLWPSYKQKHKNSQPLKMALLGFLSIALGRLHFTHLWEVSHTVIGTTLVALAHYSNWKILRLTAKTNL